jgi:phosphomannomutase
VSTIEDSDEIEVFGASFGRGSKIVVAYDGSKRGQLKMNFIIATLNSFGVSTVSLGLGSLSTISYAIRKLNLDGGVMVSDNVTFIDRFGIPLCEKDLLKTSPELVSWDKVGKQLSFDVDPYYVEDLLNSSFQLLTSSNLTANIVVDLYGGGLSKIVPEILRLTGSRVTTLNAVPESVEDDRTFDDAVNDIVNATRSWEADIGLLFDRSGNKLLAVIRDKIISGKELIELALRGLKSSKVFSPQFFNSTVHKIIQVNVNKCALQEYTMMFLRWRGFIAYTEYGSLSSPLTGLPDPAFTSICLLASKPWING